MNITTIGLDLAKSVFQVHGVDKEGKTVIQKRLRRIKVLEFFVRLPPCLSGGKPLLLGISKRGDAYLRTLMVHGARSVVRVAANKQTPTDSWTNEMSARRRMNVVSVARANKNARIVWALLAHKCDYNGGHKLAI